MVVVAQDCQKRTSAAWLSPSRLRGAAGRVSSFLPLLSQPCTLA